MRGANKRTKPYAVEVLERIEIVPSGCWLWTGYLLPNGYGQIGRNHPVHRVVWEYLRGPIPLGMTIDHECHNRDTSCNARSECPHRRCVNPDHLAIETRGQNTLKGRTPASLNMVKTRCPAGHEYEGENVYERPDRFGRQCRQCRYEIGVRYSAENRERLNERMRVYRADNAELFRAYGRERYRRRQLGLSTAGLFSELHREFKASA